MPCHVLSRPWMNDRSRPRPQQRDRNDPWPQDWTKRGWQENCTDAAHQASQPSPRWCRCSFPVGDACCRGISLGPFSRPICFTPRCQRLDIRCHRAREKGARHTINSSQSFPHKAVLAVPANAQATSEKECDRASRLGLEHTERRQPPTSATHATASIVGREQILQERRAAHILRALPARFHPLVLFHSPQPPLVVAWMLDTSRVSTFAVYHYRVLRCDFYVGLLHIQPYADSATAVRTVQVPGVARLCLGRVLSYDLREFCIANSACDAISNSKNPQQNGNYSRFGFVVVRLATKSPCRLAVLLSQSCIRCPPISIPYSHRASESRRKSRIQSALNAIDAFSRNHIDSRTFGWLPY